MSLNRDRLVQKGWGFGACFTHDSTPALCARINEVSPEGAFFVAITHDCSVVNPSLEAEPALEWLLAIPIEQQDGRCLNGRNIRRLHLEVSISKTPVWCEVTMAHRGFVSREELDQFEVCCDRAINLEGINVLKRWLANRYTSQAFPDSFNQRISGLVSGKKAPLTKLFNTEAGKVCSSVYLRLEPFDTDIPDDQEYELTAVALFSEEKAIQIGRESMQVFADEMKTHFEAVGGLNPVKVVAMDEADVTYAQIAKMLDGS